MDQANDRCCNRDAGDSRQTGKTTSESVIPFTFGERTNLRERQQVYWLLRTGTGNGICLQRDLRDLSGLKEMF